MLVPFKRMLQVNVVFACDLLTTVNHKWVLESIIALAKSAYNIHTMMNPQWFTCNDLLAIATRNNCDIMLY